jgi:MFS family permease
MAVSFIVSSGFVKTVAKWIQLTYQVQENWIPFYTGLVFLIPVIILVYLLEKIPNPTALEAAEKSLRVPMDKNERKRFFNMFSFGLVSFIFIYILLTLFRDIRDNFAADIWLELGYGNSAGIFTSTELPIAVSVLVLIASMIYIKNNKLAFQISQIIILAGFMLCGVSTFLFMQQIISGYVWIILVGLGLYMGYIPFNCILFDRMIATFKIKGNVGYFMYLVDSFGYLASVFVIIAKGSMGISISWTYFYSNGVLFLSIIGSLISITTLLYFNKKYKTYNYE